MQTDHQPATGTMLATFPSEPTFVKDVMALNMLPAVAVEDNRQVVIKSDTDTGRRALKRVVFSSGAVSSFANVDVRPVTPTEKALGIDEEVYLDGQRWSIHDIRKVYVLLRDCEGR
jgi:hypothetical protein